MLKEQKYTFEVLLYFTENSSPLSIAVINKKSDPTFNIDRIKNKKEILADMLTLNLETDVTLKCLKSSLGKHQETVKKMYERNNWDPTVINFKGFSEQKRFECLAFGKDGMFFK